MPRVLDRVCELCGTPLLRSSERYCCTGCSRVAEILEATGFTGDPRDSGAFREALRAGLLPGTGEDPSVGPDVAGSGEERTARLTLTGMWCLSCTWLIEAVLLRTPGVTGVEVHFLADLAEVRFDPAVVGRDAVVRRIERLGYGVRPEEDRSPDRGPILRLGIATFFTMNVMMISYAFHAGRGDLLGLGDGMARILAWTAGALAVPVVFGAGFPVLHRAWRAFLAHGVTMDTLVALGALSAFGVSAAEVIRGGRDIYFDGASAVVTFWLLGRVLERAAFRRASEAGEAVRRLLPQKVRRREGAGHRWVPASEAALGDVIRVEPGERVPVDGRVVEGEGSIHTAVVDGEPRPRTIEKGDRVPGGSVCGDTALDLTVVAAAESSLLAKIAGHVGATAEARGRGPEITDALARLLVPLVLVTSVVTGAGWVAHGLATAEAFERALTVLVVACPCALGIAGPLTRVVAAGALARRGIIVRSFDALERISSAEWLALDKTGTLTEGRLELAAVETVGMEEGAALSILAGLEERAGHAIADAVRRATGGRESAPVAEARVVPGQGVAGRLEEREVRAGRPAWVADGSGPVPPSLLEVVAREEGAGRTAILVSAGDERFAAVSFGDRVRPEAAAVIDRLRDEGFRIAVLSGDSGAATEAMARGLSVTEARGDCLPEDKVRWLAERRAESGRRPVFVGDGINDAPALMEAIGVAVSTGTDFAREAAEVLLLDPGLHALPVLRRCGRRMAGVVRQNLAWAGLYNLVGVPAAILGYLNPILAAGAMAASGILVTLNALRLRRIKE